MTSPFQPCCNCAPPIDCCHCTNSPSQMTVDLGTGNWSNNDCNNCTALAGDYTLDYNEALSTSGDCVWTYYDDAFCDSADPDCTAKWRLAIRLRIADQSETQCVITLDVTVNCAGNIINSPCYPGGLPEDCIQHNRSADWSHNVEFHNKTDIECGTSDFPLTLSPSFGDDCDDVVAHADCPCHFVQGHTIDIDEV